MKHVMVFAAGILAVLPALAGEPAVLRSVDPLLEPAPRLEIPWNALEARFRERAPSPGGRIVEPLWTTLLASPPGATLRVIVTLDRTVLTGFAERTGAATEEEELAYLAALEHEFVRRAGEVGFVARRGLARFPIVLGEISAGRVPALASLAFVRGIEEVRTYQTLRVEGGGLIQAGRLRTELGGTGAEIGLAVLDSGVDAGHPELAFRVVAGFDATGTTGSGAVDDNGHGTAVAGIIAGSLAGVATEVRLWSLKVLRADGSGTDFDVLVALDAVYPERGFHGGLHLLNFSIGTPAQLNTACDALSPAYDEVFDRFAEAGIAIFAGAGNEAVTTGISHPACMSQAIAVGAVYDADVGPRTFPGVCQDPQTAADQIGCFSNSGHPLEILAPSYCATTTAAGGGTLPCFGGTSAATAYASGVAAQILSLSPDTTPAQLRLALTTTGPVLTDPRNGIARHRIDALAAYEKVATGCFPGPTTLCIDDQPEDRRFRVEVDYATAQGGGAAGEGRAVPLAELGVTRGGLFWFFNPANPEMLVKVLDACVPPFERFWVFFSAGTNVGLTVTVTDTQTGRVKTYSNPDGQAALPVQDTDAFPCE